MSTTKKLYLILLIAAMAVGLWYTISLPKNQGNNKPAEVVNKATSTEQNAQATSTKDWLTYRNEEYGFEVKYPEYWQIKIDNNRLNFIDPKNYEDFYKWTEMDIKFLDNVDNLEAKILEPFKDDGYKSIQELVEKCIEFCSYSTTTIGDLSVPTLSMGAETTNSSYYLASKKKNKSYIEMSIDYMHPMKGAILSTIKIY